MPRPKSSIPKFGNWNGNEDISYSIVFDKARAEKEASFQTLNEVYENGLSNRSLSPKSNGRRGNKTYRSFPSVSAREKKEASLQELEGNGRFMVPHQIGSSKAMAEKEISRNKNYELNAPAFSSWQAAVLRDHQNFGSERYLHNLHVSPQNNVVERAHNLAMSGAPSWQSGATTERQHPDQYDQDFQGRQYMKSLGPGRHLHEEEPTVAKPKNPSDGGFDFQRGSTVPKFGDWKNGDRYTTLFDDMKKERSSQHASRRSMVRVGQLQMDQDLYNGSGQMKHQRSWLSFICCTRSYP